VKKFLIACLGNIGDEYAHTRHNIGFDIADTLNTALTKDETEIKLFADRRYAMVSYARFKGRQLVIIKPSTYMNLSGKAVNYWLMQEKIDMENLFVVTDDIALPFGKIRIKKQGSDGGHNGLSSIIKTLGTNEFPRLRFGIGDTFPRGGQVNYVLGKWTNEEDKVLPEKMAIAVDAIKNYVTIGTEKTMTLFNKK